MGLFNRTVDDLMNELKDASHNVATKRDVAKIYSIAGTFGLVAKDKALDALAKAVEILDAMPVDEKQDADLLLLAKCINLLGSWNWGTEEAALRFEDALKI